MSITVEAVYENGVLKPTEPLSLQEHARVQIIIERSTRQEQASPGVVRCTDPQLIEWAAMDADLAFPPAPEQP